MTAVHLLPGKTAAILVPVQTRRLPLMLEPLHFRFRLLPRGHVKEVQLVGRKPVAGQSVGTRLKFRATSAGRRRLNEIDLLTFARLDLKCDQCLRVWRPGKSSVSQTLLAVVAELDFLFIIARLDDNVVVLDPCGPFVIRRTTRENVCIAVTTRSAFLHA